MNDQWMGPLGRGAALMMAASLIFGSGCATESEWDEPDAQPDAQPEPMPQRSFDLCDQTLTEFEFAQFLDGNLVIVAAFTDEGSSKSRAIAELAVMMVLNGIDFANLGNARPTFNAGRYSLATGDSSLGFGLYFAEDFEQWSAGDPIPHNVFDPSSYAQNIAVVVDVGQFPPTVSLHYDPGPLLGLVEGELDINETSLALRVKLRTDLVDIQVDSGSPYEDVWEYDDSLWLQMTTTRVGLDDMLGDLEDAGFGFSYDETSYASPRSELEQEFYDSEFLTLRMDNGNYRWEGDYRSTVDKAGLTLYQSGFASNAGDNHTDYFCDPELTKKLGTAEHHDSLLFGTFRFENGDRFPYGI